MHRIIRLFSISLPQVFLEISIDKKVIGKLVFELRSDVVPKTSENFRMLCLGGGGKAQNGQERCYRNSIFHKIVPGLLVQGGDFTHKNGMGGESFYGYNFNDENFVISHNEAGTLSMGNNGPDTNGSQFFITIVPCPMFDGKNVAFGKLIRGWEVLSEIEAQGTENGFPTKIVKIIHCGEILEKD